MAGVLCPPGVHPYSSLRASPEDLPPKGSTSSQQQHPDEAALITVFIEARGHIQWLSVLNVHKSTYDGLFNKGLFDGWGVGSVVKAVTCCSTRGPGVGSQHLSDVSQDLSLQFRGI